MYGVQGRGGIGGSDRSEFLADLVNRHPSPHHTTKRSKNHDQDVLDHTDCRKSLIGRFVGQDLDQGRKDQGKGAAGKSPHKGDKQVQLWNHDSHNCCKSQYQILLID